MIRTTGLTKRFGDLTAVEDVSLEVAEGEVFGFLGPNGAGKTTTVRMLAGLIGKSGGTAEVGGCEVGRASDALKLRASIGLLPENVGLYEGTSAYENLEYFGRLYGVPSDTLRTNLRRLLEKLDLWEVRDRPVATYSKGMKQKVAIARALVHDPPILFLDEPTANLDPEASKTVRDFLLELKRDRRTVFLTTHHLDEAERICDRVGVMRTRLLAVGSPDELRARLWGSRTLVRLEQVTPALAEAVRARIGPRAVTIEGNALRIDTEDPDRQNPEIAAALVAAGGRIREMTRVTPSLEEVYLRLVHSDGRAS